MTATEGDRRGIQVIAIAFLMGPLMFLAIVVFLASRPDFERPDHDFLTKATVLAALAAVGAHVFYTRRLEAARGDAGRVRGAFVIRGALAEGAALFACVAHMVEGRLLSAAVAGAVIVFMIALQFPTAARLDAWLGT